MSLLLLLAVLAVLAVIALVAAGRGDSMPAADPDRSPRGTLPPGDLAPEDIDGLRFSLGFRGYRMDEVDDVLDRLTGELAIRDKRVYELEQRLAELEAGTHDRDPGSGGRPETPRED